MALLTCLFIVLLCSSNLAWSFRYSTCGQVLLPSQGTSRQCPLWEERHETERRSLLEHIDRKHGRWDSKHPRWKILEALHGFAYHQDFSGLEINRFEALYKHVAKKHKQILESTVKYSQNFNRARTLLQKNMQFCNAVVDHGLEFYNISHSELDEFVREFHTTSDQKQKESRQRVVRSHTSQALKHVVRDWSPDGYEERSSTFPFILNALHRYLPPPSPDVQQAPYGILVPGAGLGRLAHEITFLGPHLQVTSNEKDPYMNIAYRYIASLTPSFHPHFAIHPFLECWSHARTRNEIFRAVHVPDHAAPTSQDNLLIEGDFTTTFDTHQYDAIATLFFIDTAQNLVAYLETIHALLKPGGVWINAGPLLYSTAPFVQLSLDEVLAVAEKVGFDLEQREEAEVLYQFNATALYRNGYMAQFWVATKRTAEREKKWW